MKLSSLSVLWFGDEKPVEVIIAVNVNNGWALEAKQSFSTPEPKVPCLRYSDLWPVLAVYCAAGSSPLLQWEVRPRSLHSRERARSAPSRLGVAHCGSFWNSPLENILHLVGLLSLLLEELGQSRKQLEEDKVTCPLEPRSCEDSRTSESSWGQERHFLTQSQQRQNFQGQTLRGSQQYHCLWLESPLLFLEGSPYYQWCCVLLWFMTEGYYHWEELATKSS